MKNTATFKDYNVLPTILVKKTLFALFVFIYFLLTETVNRLHAKGFNKPGLVCDCVPSCVEPEFKVVAESKGLVLRYFCVFLL